MEYVAVIERADDGSYSAYVPDPSGRAACGQTPDEVRTLILEAVELHIESLRQNGERVPVPQAMADVVRAG